jgi:hypothetical protein
MDVVNQILSAADLVAVLGRDVTVRLVDLSGSGCLLESDTHVAAGTAGSLTVTFRGREYADAIRVNRCQPIAGTSRYHVGAEILWTSKPGAQSLRRLVVSFRTAAAEAGRSAHERQV